jgi:hypothetical protein
MMNNKKSATFSSSISDREVSVTEKRNVFTLSRLYTLLALSVLFLTTACASTSIVYPKDPASWAGCPVLSSPEPWFKWKQRYVYDVRLNGQAAVMAYMNGYGNYYKDYVDKEKNLTYKATTWLKSVNPDVIDSTFYSRIAGYDASFPTDPKGWSWYLKGTDTLIFNGDLLTFDYPLVLGKTWKKTTTVKGIFPISYEGVVVAYVPADIHKESDIVIAHGRSYKLPVSVADIPKPLAELGGKNFDELLAVPDADAALPWKSVMVPAGPKAGLNITGYYVVQAKMKLMGVTIMEQETWKDTRGYVPIVNIYRYRPLVKKTEHLIMLAKRWSGNANLSE